MLSVTPEDWIEKPEECLSLLKVNWDKLPVVGLAPDHTLRSGQLVRFRGMVQDMPNPVFYFSKYQVLNILTGASELRSGKYKDMLRCEVNETINLEGPDCETAEKIPYYCVSIPGLNDWAGEMKWNDMPQEPVLDPARSSSAVKRSAEEMDTSYSVTCKKMCTSSNNQVSSQLDLHFPIPSTSNYASLIYTYNTEAGPINLNDVIEAAGFIWQGPCEDEDLPPSLVPRIHAVVVRKLTCLNPLINHSFEIEPVINEAHLIRDDLHPCLTQLFLGDALAADYFICYLLANVYYRQDIPLGKFCLNISNTPLDEGYTEEIYNIVKLLVTKSLYLPMTLQKMNSVNLIPEKDYESQRLKSGMLQLSNLTHLVIDETKLTTGKLETKGVQNVQALNTLITQQKLDYNFKYYTMEFKTNYPILVMSEGKSLLQSDSHLVLKPEEGFSVSMSETFEAVRIYLRDPLLSKLRIYLSVLAGVDFSFHDDVHEAIQNDFVNMRQQAEESKPTADDLHALLVLARLVSLSYGQKVLSLENWQRTKNMEIQRKSRISQAQR